MIAPIDSKCQVLKIKFRRILRSATSRYKRAFSGYGAKKKPLQKWRGFLNSGSRLEN
jgi:ribosomal protein L44E